MLAFSVPPGYRRQAPPARPRLGAFTAVIDRILEEDRSAPAKQRHTAKRIHDRLRAEHGFAGGYTTVKDHAASGGPRAGGGLCRSATPPAPRRPTLWRRWRWSAGGSRRSTSSLLRVVPIL